MAGRRSARWVRGVVGVGCLVAWALLVVVAIRAGRSARGSAGGAGDWWVTGAAVAAAVVVLLVAAHLLLGAVRADRRPSRPPRVAGRRIRR